MAGKAKTTEKKVVARVERNFGNERDFGDVLETKEGKLFATIKAGFFQKKIGLVERSEEEGGGYDVTARNYSTNEDIVIGRTFPNKKKDGTVQKYVQDLTLPLFTVYSKEDRKDINAKEDSLYLRIVFLENTKQINENLTKVAFIKGQYGIEVKHDIPTVDTKEENNKEDIF